MVRYPITLTADDDAVLVACPDLPEVNSFGDNEADALTHAADAVAEAVAGRLARFIDIPHPSEGRHMVPLDLQSTLKLQLFWALHEAGKTRADLARLMGVHRPQVDRLFDPRHATRPDRYEAAFAALGRRVSVSLEAA